MITADAAYKITTDSRITFDKSNTSVQVYPHIQHNGSSYQIALDMVVISTIAQPAGVPPIEPLTEVVGRRAFAPTKDDIAVRESGIATIMDNLRVAVEKYAQSVLEAANPGVVFTRS